MKTGSKLALLAAGIGAWILAKKKGIISGIGGSDVKYIVYFNPKYHYSGNQFCWLNTTYGLQDSKDYATRFDTYEEAENVAQRLFDEKYNYYDYKDFEIIEVKDHDEERVQDAINWLLHQGESFRYSILDRMRSDCEYYLGNGNRNARQLWMKMDPQGHIDVMRAIWDSFEDKPEWLSKEQIENYAKEMGVY